MIDDSGSRSRRDFLAGGVAALAFPALVEAAGPTPGNAALVETTHGRVRGLAANGTMVFKGLPYAADTGGSNRFMAPRPAAKWAGVRDMVAFGDRAPQQRRSLDQGPDARAIGYGENCCVLNVYTPEARHSARRAVLVYLHGGGFESGSGDRPSLDGSALARLGDVVVVTLNHRLNVFGYANLGYLDPDFADASSAGQLDIVSALQWIRNNIAAFGGDPQRITIAGESGGGSKIVTLDVMPATKGLYRNSINMSGSGAFFIRPADEGHEITDVMLRTLGLGNGDLRRLQQVPADLLTASFAKVQADLKADQLRPAVDGRNIRYQPSSREGVAMQASRPGILSCTATEAALWVLRDRRNLNVTEQQVRGKIARQFGINDDAAGKVIDAYRSDEPQITPSGVLVAVATDAMIRTPMRHAAEQRVAARAAPVHVCDFTWRSVADGGIWGSPHAIDVPFLFGTMEAERISAGGGAGAVATSRNLIAAYSTFTRNGTPDDSLTPGWKSYDLSTRPSMVIDATCRAANDFRAARRRISDTLKSQSTFDITNGPMVHYNV